MIVCKMRFASVLFFYTSCLLSFFIFQCFCIFLLFFVFHVHFTVFNVMELYRPRICFFPKECYHFRVSLTIRNVPKVYKMTAADLVAKR